MSGNSDPKSEDTLIREQKLWASQIKAEWKAGAGIDAKKAIADRHDVCHSVVLDLAFEEYCLRQERGEAVDPSQFVHRFPEVAHSLEKMLLVDKWLTQAEPASTWPEVGTTDSGFHLLEELGRGAFGRVYLAEEVHLKNRRVVVKFSHHGWQEAESLAQLQHPGIVPLYSVQKSDNHAANIICMPFLSRSTMLNVIDLIHTPGKPPVNRDSIRQAASDLNRRAEVTSQAPKGTKDLDGFFESVFDIAKALADALDAAHRVGLLHRDIKPANILIDRDARTYLIDFHLSVETGKSVHAAGSLPYLPPRTLQAFAAGTSDFDEPGVQGDLYALGVTLYELAFGTHPFGPIPLGSDPRHLARWLLERHRQGVQFPAGTSRELKSLLSNLLDSGAQSPFHSAAELRETLNARLMFGARIRRMIERYRTALIASVLIMGLSGAGWWALTPSFVQQHLSNSQNAVLHEQWQTAIQEANVVLTQLPNQYQALRARAHAQLALERFEEAASDFERLLSDPDQQHAKSDLQAVAYCHLRMSNFEVARPYLMELLANDPDSSATHNNLGFLCLRENLLDEASGHINSALQKDPQCVEALFNRAILLFRRSMDNQQPVSAEALHDMEDVIRLTKVDHPEIHLMAARIAASMFPPKLEQAIGFLRRAVELGINRRRLIYDIYLKPARESEEFLELVASSDENGTNSRFLAVVPPVRD